MIGEDVTQPLELDPLRTLKWVCVAGFGSIILVCFIQQKMIVQTAKNVAILANCLHSVPPGMVLYEPEAKVLPDEEPKALPDEPCP